MTGITKFAGRDVNWYGKSTENGRIIDVSRANASDEGIKQSHPMFHRQGHDGVQQMTHSPASKIRAWHPKGSSRADSWQTLHRGNHPENTKRISSWKKQAKMSTLSSVPFKSTQKSMNRANKLNNKQNFRSFPFVNQSFDANNFQIPFAFANPYKSIVPNQSNNNFSNKKPIQTVSQTELNAMSSVVSRTPKINVQDLFQKLLQHGLVEEKPSLNKPETLKKRNSSAVSALYAGWQCSSCGIRFPTEETAKHREHLDWHCQQNRQEKNAASHSKSQKWYLSATEWVQIDSSQPHWLENETKLPATETSESSQSIPNCVAAHDQYNEECDVCHDSFEMFYDDDNEEWYLRNAIRKGRNVYHPICYEDK